MSQPGRASGRVVHVGVGLGADRIVAVVFATRLTRTLGPTWSRALSDSPGTIEGWSDLAIALREMHTALGASRGMVHLALLPPLVQVRNLQLPRLNAEDRRRVLSRDASRYFLGARAPQVVASRVIGRNRASPQSVLATAVPASFVERLSSLVTECGWTLGSLTPAHSGLAEAGSILGLSAGTGRAIVVGDDTAEILEIVRGSLVGVRRCPAGAEVSALAAPLPDGQSRAPDHALVVLGACLEERGLVHRLKTAGHRLITPAAEGGTDPAAIAARFAGTPALELVPEGMWAERRRWSRQLSRRLWGIAASLLLLAGALEAFGKQRELTAVLSARTALHSRVAKALIAREGIEELQTRLGTLAQAEGSATRWSLVLGRVASRLPRDAHLALFRGHDDSLALGGEAQHAVGVFEALQRAPGFVGVRADAPIRQEAGDSQTPIERFTLSAELRATSDSMGIGSPP